MQHNATTPLAQIRGRGRTIRRSRIERERNGRGVDRDVISVNNLVFNLKRITDDDMTLHALGASVASVAQQGLGSHMLGLEVRDFPNRVDRSK